MGPRRCVVAANLEDIGGFPFNVEASTGFAEVAATSAALCASAKEWLDSLLGFSPTITLRVLNRQDWAALAAIPTYGMPHCDARHIVMSAEKADFWQGNIGRIREYLPEAIDQLRSVYADDSGEIDLTSYFRTLVVHELGHTYHEQYPFHFPRLWLQELFANLCNHLYLANAKPALLETLVTFPRWASQVPASAFEYTTWGQFEEFYPPIMQPSNYGWYQSRLKSLAANLYDSQGNGVLARLWHKFAVSDADLCRAIDEELSLGLSDLILP